MNKLLAYVILPTRMTEFEVAYLKRMNRMGLGVFLIHVPVFCAIAYFNGTGPLAAALLTLGVLIGPVTALATFQNPRAVSMVYGFTAMLMGALLVHFGSGPVQIEMHFYFFAMLAMLAVYANPMVIVVAAITVALHHLAFWAYLPGSIFNYAAPLWVVAVHSAFVVVESVATCFIARSFFDNVIGLEQIVSARTAALDERNDDLRLVLGHVGQGFLTIDLNGVMSEERSAIIETWLGPAEATTTFADYLGRRLPDVATQFRFCWREVVAGDLLLELTLDQMPRRFELDGRHYEISYTPILKASELQKVLLVISDVTSQVERQKLEQQQREVVNVYEQVARDRSGFLEFVQETDAQVLAIESGHIEDPAILKRVIHTLKGNALMFDVRSVGELCHAMETRLAEEESFPTAAERAELSATWNSLRANIKVFFGERELEKVELDAGEYDEILQAVQSGESRDKIASIITGWRLEPTSKRLARVADQARAIANRLSKGPIHVDIDDRGLRLDAAKWASFWSAFAHVVRNGIDHGLESPEHRRQLGKPSEGVLRLCTRIVRDDFVIEFTDDGGGIDWSSVARSASKKGLPNETRADLIEAIFHDGITTSTEVSEFSGRGIGMGAMRAACHARGGTLHIVSEPGRGTTIEFRFAREQMTADKRRSVPPEGVVRSEAHVGLTA